MSDMSAYLALVREGKSIAAIKQYRVDHAVSLTEAKRAVEAMIEEHFGVSAARPPSYRARNHARDVMRQLNNTVELRFRPGMYVSTPDALVEAFIRDALEAAYQLGVASARRADAERPVAQLGPADQEADRPAGEGGVED